MKGSQLRTSSPVIDGDHDKSYTLRKFIDTDQFTLSACRATKMKTEQFEPEDSISGGSWTDVAVDNVSEKSTYGPMASRSWKGEEVMTLWTANDSIPQLTKAPVAFSNDTLGSNAGRQNLSTKGVWHRFDESMSPRENLQHAISNRPVSGVVSQPLTPMLPDERCPETSCIVQGGPPHPLAVFEHPAQPSIHSPFSSYQIPHTSGQANYARDFPSSAPSTISNSVSPLSSTPPERPDHPTAASQPRAQMQGPYQVHIYTSNPQIYTDDVAQDLASLDLSYQPSSFPTVNGGQWYGTELSYRCSSTPALSSCSTPDGSFELPDSTVIDDIAYENTQADPEGRQGSAHTWAGPLSFQSISGQTSNQAVQTVRGDKQGPGRVSGKLSSQRSDCRDAFLVQCKRSGMSYKDIKEKGQFVEAESTLRGRFRTLTKRKEHRVRKPGWHGKDLKLLCDAVRRYTDSRGFQSADDIKAPKISWKQVGEYIWNNGGSYHFGNATCKKKWEELQQGAVN